MTSETLFSALPRETQKRIDSAFDLAAQSEKFAAKSSLEELPAGGFIPESGGFVREDQGNEFEGGFIHEDEPGGGFILDYPGPSALGGGGFLVEDHKQNSVNSRIPLSLIPAALQHLDLAPDDGEVLAVFRNAATGWTSSRNDVNNSQKLGEQDQFVSREDWRSVCAVLLEHDSEENDVEMSGLNTEPGSVEDSDNYQESEVDAEEAWDDDDYTEGPTTRRRTRQTAYQSPHTSPSPSTSPAPRPRKLTSRQRQTCVDAYALFFPTAPMEELLDQRVMVRDVQRVAKVLNEKLKTQEASVPSYCSTQSIEINETEDGRNAGSFLHIS